MTKGFDADIIFRSADRRHADKGMDGLLLWPPCQRIDFPGEGKPQVEIGRIFGVLAQMVERCVRIAEVRGSTPLGSTTSPQAAYRLRRLFYKSHRRAYSAASPFPKKVTLRLRCPLVNALATIRLATNLFRGSRVRIRLLRLSLQTVTLCSPVWLLVPGSGINALKISRCCAQLFASYGVHIPHPNS